MRRTATNKKDPICGMTGTLKVHGHHFCGQHCVDEWVARQKGKRWAWYKEKFFLVLVLTAILLIVSRNVPFLRPVYDAYMDYFMLIWWAILLGLLISGLVDYYVPDAYVSHFLSRKKKTTILYATGLGFIMSACSHGILAIAIELYKKGASIPSVISFLLAAPWANFTVTILLFGFFGVKAFYLVASAIVIAIITGLIYQVLDKYKLIETAKEGGNDFDFRKDIKKRWKKYRFNLKRDTHGVVSGMWALNKMVMWWILIGILMAAIARAFVPAHLFHDYMGPTIIGLGITLVVATLIEVCSEGSSPIAFEIFRQTGAFGNSFVFLMAGVSTDYTEVGLLWSNIGKKTAIWLPLITVPQILVLGYLFNILL